MRKHLRKFIQSDSGAITVDWVVLTAAVVGLAIAAVAVVKVSAIALGPEIGNEIDRQMPN